MIVFPSAVDRCFTNLAPGIRIRKDKVRWPEECLVSGELFNGNNHYKDLRGKTWQQAQRAYQLEQDLFAKIDACRSDAAEHLVRQEMLRLGEMFEGLDAGTAAAVYAISAGSGIPVSSCNGGCFGGGHSELFPVVSFWWHPSKVPLLRECAKQARLSMWLHHRGEVVVGARTIRRMLSFAGAILERRNRL